MTFTKEKPENKNFGKRDIRVASIRVPADQYEVILAVMKDYVSNFKEDNVKKIETIKDSIEEIISMHLDVKDYVRKEKSITSDKYYSILFNHNENLIDDLIDNFSIERKKPVKTLTEENREKELKKENSTSSVWKPPPIYKPMDIDKLLKENRKRAKKRNKRR